VNTTRSVAVSGVSSQTLQSRSVSDKSNSDGLLVKCLAKSVPRCMRPAFPTIRCNFLTFRLESICDMCFVVDQNTLT